MKQIILSVALSLGFASAALADPVEGTWKVAPKDAAGYLHVAITQCGSKFCGTIKASFYNGGTPDPDYEHLGKKMIWDMAADGDGNYTDGKIWTADNGKTYNSKMSLNGDILVVKGCVMAGLICRGLDWPRVN